MSPQEIIAQLILPQTQTPNLFWNEYYKNLKIKIVLHSIGKDYTPESYGTWCSYIYLSDTIINLDEFNRYIVTPPANYYDNRAVTDIPLHGGVTWYRRLDLGIIEVGCDWNHSWDQEAPHATYAEVLANAQAAIDHVLCPAK